MYKVLKGWIDQHLSDEEAVLFAAILALSIVIIVTMGAVLGPLFAGIVFAYVMQGLIKTLARYQIPNAIAVTLTFLMFLGGFIGFLFLIIPRVWRQLRALFTELPSMVNESQVLLEKLPENYPTLISQHQVDTWIEMLNSEAGDIGQWILSFSLSQLPIVVTVVVYLLLVPILVFFLLKDKDQLLGWFLSFLPKERPLMNQVGAEMNLQMENYIRGKFIEFLIAGGVSYIFFALFGLNYAALLAFLVGLSVIIPYLGLIAVTIPVVIIAYLQYGWSASFFYVVLGYSLIQGTDGLVLVPLLFSEAVNLHPIAIILAVLVFGSWWGLWGVFFAIPLATLIKATMTAWPSNRVDGDGVPDE
ncbi:MAG: AI-2E family transporter [Gammaproteobacteria bacterium]|jgi:putative permease|nr:AI-2E family transporter [Gammaproteobacteria bacterium]|tara:strand:- start:3470 stop:4546 length:1077 start_codon:yes stop_codon:yes gene_type:complete